MLHKFESNNTGALQQNWMYSQSRIKTFRILSSQKYITPTPIFPIFLIFENNIFWIKVSDKHLSGHCYQTVRIHYNYSYLFFSSKTITFRSKYPMNVLFYFETPPFEGHGWWSVLLLSTKKFFFLGYFDPGDSILDNQRTYFSGWWPNPAGTFERVERIRCTLKPVEKQKEMESVHTVSTLRIQTKAFFSTDLKMDAEQHREKIWCHSVRTINVLRMQSSDGEYDIIWRIYMSVKFGKCLNA